MAEDQHRQAVKYGRLAVARYRAGKYRRAIGPANKAETALFSLVAGESDGTAAAYAFGEVAAVRSVTMTLLRGDLPAAVARQAARAALWAFDHAAREPGEVRTEFRWSDDDPGTLPRGRRVAAAADARLALAERLVAQPRRPADPDALGAAELRAPAEEVLVWRYHPAAASDTHAEARALAREAVQTYEDLAATADRFGLAGEDRAKERAAAVERQVRKRVRRPAR